MYKKLNAQLVSYLQQTSLVFRVWFAEFDAEVWDRQFEEDVAAGRLNNHYNILAQDVALMLSPIGCYGDNYHR